MEYSHILGLLKKTALKFYDCGLTTFKLFLKKFYVKDACLTCDPYSLRIILTYFRFSRCSGLSPFLDDSVEETTTNILKCDFCFPDEYFETISNEAKDLLSRLLCLRSEDRANAEVSLASSWFKVNYFH